MNTPASSPFLLLIPIASLVYAGAATFVIGRLCRFVLFIPPPPRWLTFGIFLALFLLGLGLPYWAALKLMAHDVTGSAWGAGAGLWQEMGEAERVSLITALLAASFGLLLWFPVQMGWAEDYGDAFVYFVAIPVLALGVLWSLVGVAIIINRALS